MIAERWTRVAWIAALTWLCAACSVAPGSERMMESDASAGYATGLDRAGLDGVASSSPSTGAFFNDGESGDVRGGRTENFFGEPIATEPAAPAARLMVRTAELGIEVPRPEDSVRDCEQLTEAHGGYVSRRRDSSLTCRVPAARFEEFVAAVRAMGRVLHESMQALDVTDQHRDLTIRLDNAKTSRERLLVLLEKAEKVEDLLKIEKELRRLTEEIERMTAELKNLGDRVALSTIEVEFRATAEPKRPPVPQRRPHRVFWINQLGAEHVLRRF